MITSYQLASLPLWAVGFIFVIVAIAIGLGGHAKPGEKRSEQMGQCGVGIIMGTPFLIFAAWMWNWA